MPNELKSIEDKLEQVIALLKMVVSDKIVEKRHAILSTPKKQRIYEMCDGNTEMGEIAEKASASGEYVRLTIKDLEEAGFVIVRSEGTRRYPKKVI